MCWTCFSTRMRIRILFNLNLWHLNPVPLLVQYVIIIIIIIQERQSDAIEKIYRVDGSHIKRSNRKNSQLYGE